MCLSPIYETLSSAVLFKLVSSRFDQKDILKFIFNQYSLRMDDLLRIEALVLLNSIAPPDNHKLNNIKNNGGLNSLLKSNIPLQLHSWRS